VCGRRHARFSLQRQVIGAEDPDMHLQTIHSSACGGFKAKCSVNKAESYREKFVNVSVNMKQH